MLPIAHIGLSSSRRAGLRGAFVVLAWLALWISMLVATLEAPRPPRDADVHVKAAARA
jgi:hypothetical protein